VSVVRAVSPSVVQIRTPQDLGSGVVFDARGDVVTNAHVAGNATRFIVTLASGDSHSATAMGRDDANDLAVIRIAGARPRPATFADSSEVEVGDIALALGNPLGLRSSVTEGIVSAVGRSVPEGDGVTLSSAIQTSAAINPGNSGGALVDLSGRVIGIPTLAALDPQMGASESPGIGFAIDSTTVRRVAGLSRTRADPAEYRGGIEGVSIVHRVHRVRGAAPGARPAAGAARREARPAAVRLAPRAARRRARCAS
jgi:S1-C subfamily serine protease